MRLIALELSVMGAKAHICLIYSILHVAFTVDVPKTFQSSAFPSQISRFSTPTAAPRSNNISTSPERPGTASSSAASMFNQVRCPVVEHPIPCDDPPCPMAVAMLNGPCYSERDPTVTARPNGGIRAELQSECVLWDSSCSGDKTQAVHSFLRKGGAKDYLLVEDSCFMNQTGCDSSLSSEYTWIKSWMRSQECKSELSQDCCERCSIWAGNIDIFYWPEPHKDTSCLSIIGDEVYPVRHGMTRGSRGQYYWGCTTWRPDKGLMSTIMTATLMTDGKLNPRSSSPRRALVMLCQRYSATKMHHLQPS